MPVVSVLAALCAGETRIENAARLRIKESDRLSAMAAALTAAGADAAELPDGLAIRGGKTLHAAKIEGCNDHRIVMAMTIASALSDGFVGTDDSSLIERLGGKVLIVEGKRDNIKLTVPEDYVLLASAVRTMLLNSEHR